MGDCGCPPCTVSRPSICNPEQSAEDKGFCSACQCTHGLSLDPFNMITPCCTRCRTYVEHSLLSNFSLRRVHGCHHFCTHCRTYVEHPERARAVVDFFIDDPLRLTICDACFFDGYDTDGRWSLRRGAEREFQEHHSKAHDGKAAKSSDDDGDDDDDIGSAVSDADIKSLIQNLPHVNRLELIAFIKEQIQADTAFALRYLAFINEEIQEDDGEKSARDSKSAHDPVLPFASQKRSRSRSPQRPADDRSRSRSPPPAPINTHGNSHDPRQYLWSSDPTLDPDREEPTVILFPTHNQ
jgi:hypothetical protein